MTKISDKRVLLVLTAIFFIDAVVISFFTMLYFWGSPFLAYGIRNDLRGHEDKIQKIIMNEDVKNEIFSKLDEIRISVDQKNNFTFFKWINFDDSLDDILKDDKITKNELNILMSDIKQMQNIQNIKTSKTPAEANDDDTSTVESK